MKSIVIIGAGGHGRVVANIAKLNGYDDIKFLDDDETLTQSGPYPVAGRSSEAASYDCDLFVAVGNAKIRRRLMEELSAAGKHFPVLIHPSAVVEEDVRIGDGTVIMAQTSLNVGASVGRGCIINTAAIVDHDCTVCDYAHVSANAMLAGTTEIGEETWVGTGATVSNNIRVAGGCMIGVGAAVVRDITEPGTYVGVPAKRLK